MVPREEHSRKSITTILHKPAPAWTAKAGCGDIGPYEPGLMNADAAVPSERSTPWIR